MVEPLKKVVLLERMPLLFKGNCTFYKEGTEFEVVEIKQLPQVGECYKVKGFGVTFDGWILKKQFRELK